MTDREKIQKALAPLRASDAVVQEVLDMAERKNTNTMKKSARTLLIAAVIAVLLVGSALAVNGLAGGRGLLRYFNLTDEEIESMAETTGSPISAPIASDTHNGITLSVERSIIDADSVRAAIRIEGLTVPEGQEPYVYEAAVFLDGERVGSLEWSVYNGLTWTGTDFVYDDGNPAEKNGEGDVIPRYVRADGSIELDLGLTPDNDVSGDIPGREITVQINAIGCSDHWNPENAITGPWVLTWTAEGDAAKRTWELNEPLGDTGAALRTVMLSAASVSLRYDYPEPAFTEIHEIDQDGNTSVDRWILEPPSLHGFIMRDGTECAVMTGGGRYGYDDVNGVYTVDASLTRIIDPDEVAALVFREVGTGGEPDGGTAVYYTVTLPE